VRVLIKEQCKQLQFGQMISYKLPFAKDQFLVTSMLLSIQLMQIIQESEQPQETKDRPVMRHTLPPKKRSEV
jgi:hypothetical protein